MGCQIGPNGEPWYLVCRHVTDDGAPALAYPEQPDGMNCVGIIACASCDALTQKTGRWDSIKDQVVGICAHCCRGAGWIKPATVGRE